MRWSSRSSRSSRSRRSTSSSSTATAPGRTTAEPAPEAARRARTPPMPGGRGTPKRCDPLVPPLVKRAKRSAQDDQNACSTRCAATRAGRPREQVLRDDDGAGRRLGRGAAQRARRRVRGGPGSGRCRAGSRARRRPLREAAETIAFPLRDRIAAAIDDVDAGDTSGLVERIGARYREWKNQQLEHALGDVMVMAWSRGVYDGSDDGTVLAVDPLVRGSLRRLRRQRVGADGEGRDVPDRTGPSARALRVAVACSRPPRRSWT